MTLGPWLLWVPLLALINLLVFIAIRGRWGRIVPVLGGAAIIGVLIGDEVGERVGLELLRIGDMNIVAASLAAQVLMVAVTLLAALGPIRIEE
ncbi:MAG: hypothetical protein H0W98_05545 [Chloroflexi bacterium]|nr:hypothetical protein [Chloroflexota bacterium]MBA3740591.1 hypothetical protein [Chloroflexota bacterium]